MQDYLGHRDPEPTVHYTVAGAPAAELACEPDDAISQLGEQWLALRDKEPGNFPDELQGFMQWAAGVCASWWLAGTRGRREESAPPP